MSALNSSNPDEPNKFEEAWHHPDVQERGKWREAIRKEFRDMTNRGVWRKIKRASIPTKRRIVGCKWVFKIKRNGVYRARLVALGYSQIPGVDFTDNFAPVVNDVTFRLMLSRKIIEKLSSRIIDVETAFLHGELEEEIFMEIPKGYRECGYEVGIDECLALIKSIYGLVQAARQYWRKFVSIMKSFGFELSKADPCLMFRENENGICMIAIYVDDNYLVGNQDAIDEATNQLKEKFSIKIEDEQNDYLGCEFHMSEVGGWLGQPHIFKALEMKFGDILKNSKAYATPGTPGFTFVKPEIGSELNVDQQKMYRSGVGMLLYLLKHSRPDLSNPIRELSRGMDLAGLVHLKELKRVVKYAIDTKEKGLKMMPNNDKTWELVALSDSDFATDKVKRVSVTGYVIYFMGIPVAWRSRGQKGVTLSTSEAEYVALSEVVKELKFITQVLETMKVNVKLPITVHIDNVGAIFMATNQTSSDRTKHVDVRYHFVREFIEDGVVKIKFVRSKENDADLFTKNVNGELYDNHSQKLVWSKSAVVHP